MQTSREARDTDPDLHQDQPPRSLPPQDIRKLMEEEEVKRSAQNGFRRSETVSQGSSLATPRGELSYMGLVESDEKFPGSGETRSTSGSGPTRKRSEGLDSLMTSRMLEALMDMAQPMGAGSYPEKTRRTLGN